MHNNKDTPLGVPEHLASNAWSHEPGLLHGVHHVLLEQERCPSCSVKCPTQLPHVTLSVLTLGGHDVQQLVQRSVVESHRHVIQSYQIIKTKTDREGEY